MDVLPLTIPLPEESTGGMSVLLIGSTRSGKTTLLTSLLDTTFRSHIGVLMSPNIHAPIYRDCSLVTAPEYIPSVVQEMVKINKETKNHYPFLCVLDDVVHAKFDKDLLKLFTIHRNAGVSAIMSIQSPVLLNSAMRGNVNVILLGFMNSDESCERVIRMFCYTGIPGRNIEAKIKEYKRLTADHHFLMLNNLTGEFSRTKLKV